MAGAVRDARSSSKAAGGMNMAIATFTVSAVSVVLGEVSSSWIQRSLGHPLPGLTLIQVDDIEVTECRSLLEESIFWIPSEVRGNQRVGDKRAAHDRERTDALIAVAFLPFLAAWQNLLSSSLQCIHHHQNQHSRRHDSGMPPLLTAERGTGKL